MANSKDLPPLDMVGEDGNAFAIMGKAHKAYLKFHRDLGEIRAVAEAGWQKIREEMMAGDYDHLIQTVIKNFDVR